MDKIDDAAFPVHGGLGREIDDPRNRILGGGLSKREWFAGQALANPYTAHDSNPDKVAEWAVSVADALIAALKTEGR